MINKSEFKSQISFLQKQKPAALTLLFSAIIVDTVLISSSSDFIIFGLLGLYVAGIKIYNLNSRTSLIFCFVLLAVMHISFLISGSSQRTEKAAVWLFFFFLISIVQQFRE